MEKYWEFTGNEIEGSNGVKLKEIRCTRAIVINTLSAKGVSVTAPNFQDDSTTNSMIEDELNWKVTIRPGEIGVILVMNQILRKMVLLGLLGVLK